MHNKDTIITTINEIIAGKLGVEPEAIRPSDHFVDDLFGSPQEVSEIVLELEHAYDDDDLIITPEEMAGLETVDKLYDVVLDKLGVFA